MNFNINRARVFYSFVNRIRVIALFLLATLYSNLYGQHLQVSAKLESDNIKIGEETKLILKISYKVDNGKANKIIFPATTDTIRKEIEINSESKIDTIIPDKNKPFEFIQSKTLYITSFDSGYWAIPPFAFLVDTTKYETEALLLHVGSVAVDTASAIKDIKEPFEEPYGIIDWIKDNKVLLGGILLAILVIIIAIYQYKKYLRNRKNIKVEPPKPLIPPHLLALQKLEALQNEKLWQEGKTKMYYSKLSEIAREYIELRFKIQALEQTTEEILHGFKSYAVAKESMDKLKQILVLADLVKFAKEQPLPAENEMSISNAIDFIKDTTIESTDNTMSN
jgi:hypothetical protein